MMYYHEEAMDLFKVEQGAMLAHCISEDFALGAGVAREIDERFNMKKLLNLLWKDQDIVKEWSTPCCLPASNVFNLVTKRRCYEKPTLQSLETALLEMKEYAKQMFVKKIAMPKIGCGLDRLDWDDVSQMIQGIFADTDIEILVCCQ